MLHLIIVAPTTVANTTIVTVINKKIVLEAIPLRRSALMTTKVIMFF